MERAVFLDRDGTLTERYSYPSRPEHLRLYADIGPGLRMLQTLGFKLVVVTNQSGVARGYFTEATLRGLHDYLADELRALGVTLAAIEYCPHHPDGVVPELRRTCDCRKPEAGMLLRAAAQLDLDLHASWLIGDILDDVEAGNRVGCRTVLVDLGTEAPPTTERRRPTCVARNTRAALAIVAAIEQGKPAPEAGYLPPTWRDLIPDLSLARRGEPETVSSQPAKAGVAPWERL